MTAAIAPMPLVRRLLEALALVIAGAVVVAAGALAAQAALWLSAPPAAAPRVTIVVPAPAADPRAAGHRADPSAIGSPAAGTTGTAALPPPPANGVVQSAEDVAGAIARPFSLKGIAAADRARAIECLTAAIYYEAASEPDAGQRGVAQVVLNRVRHPAFPATVCGVVYQGSEHAGCQFSFACDGALARAPARGGWARAARNAAAMLNGQVAAEVGLATHYHTYAVTPAWNRTLVMTDAIGAHFFHRWKGYWGTAAAFAQRYRGHEPLPGPHARLAISDAEATVPVAAATPVLQAAPAPHAVAPPAEVQPAHADSGMPLAPAPASQVLDRWKDSGKPLR